MVIFWEVSWNLVDNDINVGLVVGVDEVFEFIWWIKMVGWCE